MYVCLLPSSFNYFSISEGDDRRETKQLDHLQLCGMQVRIKTLMGRWAGCQFFFFSVTYSKSGVVEHFVLLNAISNDDTGKLHVFISFSIRLAVPKFLMVVSPRFSSRALGKTVGDLLKDNNIVPIGRQPALSDPSVGSSSHGGIGLPVGPL